MYRLAHVIGVSWQSFQSLELWEIRNLAFVTGEMKVAAKIEHLEVLLAHQNICHSDNPNQLKADYIKQFKSAVTVEPELTSDEFLAYAIEHNKRELEALNNANK